MKSGSLSNFAVVGLAVVGLVLSLPAAAQGHGGGAPAGGHGGGPPAGGGHPPGGGHPGGGWHGGGWYGGGPGWWGWGLGLGLGWDLAYMSNPYLYYPDPGYYYPYAPPPVIVEPPAPAPESAPPAPPAAANWFYCESAQAYYPYVAQCPEPWRVIPAAPPGAAH